MEPLHPDVELHQVGQHLGTGHELLCGSWIQVVLAYLFPRLTLCEDESPENMDLTYRLVQ